jgi:hypothetical protein
MKILCTILFCFTTTILYSQNGVNYSLVDSITIFSKVDSLKLEGHTEFYITNFNIYYTIEEELNLIIEKLGNKIYPEGFVLYYLSKGFYPRTEYMNDNTYRYYDKTFFYIYKNELGTNILILSPSPKFNR